MADPTPGPDAPWVVVCSSCGWRALGPVSEAEARTFVAALRDSPVECPRNGWIGPRDVTAGPASWACWVTTFERVEVTRG